MPKMADEEKKVETETTEEATEEVVEETNTDAENSEEEVSEEGSDIEKSEEKSEDNIDYKAEIEKEEGRKPDPELAKQKFKERQEKRQGSDDEDYGTTDKDEIKSIIREEREALRKEARQFEAERIANQMARSEDEAKLIMLKWQRMSFDENTNLYEQIEDAFAVANKKKLIGENQELKRALAGKSFASKDASGSRGSETKSKEPSLDAGDKLILQQAKMTYNASTRRYEKKLGSGKVQFYDAKEKRLKISQ